MPQQKAVKKIVKKLIDASIEDKHYNYFLNSNSVGSFMGPNSTSQYLPLAPFTGFVSISQGTAQGQRIGNRIRIKKAILDMYFVMNQRSDVTNLNPNPKFLILYFVLNKADKSNPVIPMSSTASFLRTTTGVQQFVGTVDDMLKNVNTDQFQLHKKVIVKLGYAYLTIATGQSTASYANNDFKYVEHLKFDVTKYLNKTYTYDNNADLSAAGNVPTLLWEVVNADTSTNSDPGLASLKYNYRVSYEDA
jgi:hypothetical protein